MHFLQTVVAFLLLVLTTSKKRKGTRTQSSTRGVGRGVGAPQQYLLHPCNSGSGKNILSEALVLPRATWLLSCQEMCEKCKHIRMKLEAIYFLKSESSVKG